MGVLDDAIRQHLELKRSHGADEAELQRKESEALGPVRREAEPAADQDALPDEPSAEEPVAEQSPAEAPAEEPVAFADDDPFADDEPFADAPAVAEQPPPPIDEAPPVPVPAPPAEEPRTSDTPTRGFDALSADEVEDDLFTEEPAPPPAEPPAVAAEPPPADGSEDVLEETPEFLQETPEHDRLWFEQKPPRDFDFDDDQK